MLPVRDTFHLVFAAKKIRKAPTPYMEAVSIGNGYIPVRSNLLRSLAAILTIGSGASIGREGPLVQTVTVFASIFGRRLNFSPPRLRLIVACLELHELFNREHTRQFQPALRNFSGVSFDKCADCAI